MEPLLTEKLTFTPVQHLPIVKHNGRKIKLVETIDAMADSRVQLPPGMAVMASETPGSKSESNCRRCAPRTHFFDGLSAAVARRGLAVDGDGLVDIVVGDAAGASRVTAIRRSLPTTVAPRLTVCG